MTVAVPPHIQQQRQQQAMHLASLRSMRMQLAGEVYTKIVAAEYQLQTMAARQAAVKEADPFNTRDATELAQELPEKVSFNVDVNNAAEFSFHAADTLLFHAGLIDEEGQPITGPPAAKGPEQKDVGDKRSDGGIILAK